MDNKKLFALMAAALVVIAVPIVIFQISGIPLKDFIAGMVAYSLYGLLIVVYALRCALPFIGVYAIYRLLQGRHHKQEAI
jgi:hypothetical protein